MDKMDWEALIREVQSRRALWDKAHPQHHHRGVLDKCWTEVSKRMKASVKEVRHRWKYLRDQYRREIRKYPEGPTYDTTWPFFPQLHFLKDQMNPKKRTPTSPDHSEDSQSLYSIKIENHHLDSSDFEQPLPEEAQDDEPLQRSRTPTKSLKRPPSSGNSMSGKQQRLEEKEADSKASNQEETSDDYHFFMSLLPMMRNFNDLQKMRIRNKFQQTIIEEMSKLHEYQQGASASHGLVYLRD